MTSRLFLFSLFISTCCWGQGQKKKVLFLGNSYTQYNNLPGLIASAAASVGDTLVFDFNYPGGYTFDQHIQDNQSINKIKAGGWDFVVLQEQSQRPAMPQYSLSSSMALCALIRQHNPCARPLFFRTWGRKNGDTQFCSSWPPVCTYNGMDSLLNLRYRMMGMTNHTEVSPVGSTWKYLRQQFPAIELYNADQSHPSLAGSYAAACSFYASIFKKNPAAITYNGGLNATTASNIRQAAKLVVFDSLASWHFPDAQPTAGFGYMAGPGANEIRFINHSLRARHYFWNFGDGDTSTKANPTHLFPANSSYTVSLSASRCDLDTVYEALAQKTIQFCAFTPVVSPDTIMLCTIHPDTLWTQNYDGYQWFDGNGDSIPNANGQYFIPTSSGYHSVLTSQNGCAEMSLPAFVDAFVSFNFYYIQPVANDTICLGDTVLLLLKPVTSPMPADRDIEWFLDGIPIPFSGNDTLKVTGSGQFHAVVYDSIYCPGSPIFTTSSLPITFNDCQVSVSKKTRASEISIFPNPGKDFTIRIPKNMVGSTYWLVDMMGKSVQSGELDSENNVLKMDEAKSGIYFLRIGAVNIRISKW